MTKRPIRRSRFFALISLTISFSLIRMAEKVKKFLMDDFPAMLFLAPSIIGSAAAFLIGEFPAFDLGGCIVIFGCLALIQFFYIDSSQRLRSENGTPITKTSSLIFMCVTSFIFNVVFYNIVLNSSFSA